jgi:hypothetical protein
MSRALAGTGGLPVATGADLAGGTAATPHCVPNEASAESGTFVYCNAHRPVASGSFPAAPTDSRQSPDQGEREHVRQMPYLVHATPVV